MPRRPIATEAPVTVVDALAVAPELGNPAVSNTSAPAVGEQTFALVALDRIHPSGDNPRAADPALADPDLAESIRLHGVLEPLIVIPFVDATMSVEYSILAGHRRWAAAQVAGLTEVPAVIRHDLAEADAFGSQVDVLRLVENLQRRDLSPVEEARAFDRLVKIHGMSQADVAAQVGRNQGHVSKRLKMLALGDAGLALVEAGTINLEDAVDLARFPAGVRDDVIDAVGRGLVAEVQIQNARIRLEQLAERGTEIKALKKAGAPFVDLAAKGAEIPEGYRSAAYIRDHAGCPDRLVVVTERKGYTPIGYSWTEEYCSPAGHDRHDAERVERNAAAAAAPRDAAPAGRVGVITEEQAAAAKADADRRTLLAGLAEARAAHCVKVLGGKLPRTTQDLLNRGILALALSATRTDAIVASPAPALVAGVDALTPLDRDGMLRAVVSAYEGGTADVALRLALATLMATGEYDYESALDDHAHGREIDWATPTAAWYAGLLVATGYVRHELEGQMVATLPSPLQFAGVTDLEPAAVEGDDEYATPDDDAELAEVDAIRAADIEAGHDGAADLA